MRRFGETGLMVPALGLGAGPLGDASLDESEIARLLQSAVDLGVTLFDSAPSYGVSEERIGRHLASRRNQIVLSTKGGYGVEGVPDWTYEVIVRGVEAALARLRTDRIDIFHLHSCPRETLERGEVIRALEDVQRAGKIRVAAYSGENDALAFAIASGRFGSIQCSINLVDQRSLELPIARLGVIAKRPLMNAAWRFRERPVGDYAEVYWERLQGLRAQLGERDWANVALRFSAFAPGVSTIIVGTRSLENLRHNANALAEGPLAPPLVEEIRSWFRQNDRDWPGQI